MSIDLTAKDEKRERRDFGVEDVLKRLSYDPETGHFKWVVRVMCYGGGRWPGDIAGTISSGYVQIKLYGRLYRAQHLAWLLMTGEWPDPSLDIDHKDRDRSNNRWSNLRQATRPQNIANAGLRSDNKSGVPGVSMRKDTGKWHARITVDKKIILLGDFATLEQAIEARQAANELYHGKFLQS